MFFTMLIFNFCQNVPFWLTDRVGIVIWVLALWVASYTAILAKETQEKNEKFLTYSFRLDRKHKEANWNRKTQTNKEKEELKRAIQEVVIIRRLLSNEFPDPTIWKDYEEK